MISAGKGSAPLIRLLLQIGFKENLAMCEFGKAGACGSWNWVSNLFAEPFGCASRGTLALSRPFDKLTPNGAQVLQ